MSRYLRQIRRQLYSNIFNAYKGWWYWHLLCKKYQIDNTAVILMPSENRDYNFTALLYLNQMLDAKSYKNAVVLTYDPSVAKSANLFSDRIIGVELINRKKAEYLMQYYCLYEFDKRLIIASLDEPNGRNGLAVVGKHGITLEETFVIGVYKLYPFYKPVEPVFHGNDQMIKDFICPKKVVE